MPELRARIFDVQRFSLNDGPGVRTTIFFQGCNLRCAWCHNPESMSPTPQLGYFADLCVHCGACHDVCPEGVHTVGPGSHTLDRSRCSACGRCVEACPASALKIFGREATIDELFDLALRDRAYYGPSGGGVTFSGGEASLQHEFVVELATRLRHEGLSTALETHGVVASSVLKSLLPVIGLFLVDWKVSDEATALRYTGGVPSAVERTLRLLQEAGARVHLRCPIIPGVNDSAAHRAVIAGLAKRFSCIEQTEELPYHRWGNRKWAALGREEPCF